MVNRARDWLAPARPATTVRVTDPAQRRAAGLELVIVFVVTLGYSGLTSMLSLLDDLLRPVPLNQQHVAITVPQARAGLLDLIGQLAIVARDVGMGALGLYLVWRAGIALASIGLDRRAPRADLLGGLGLAALVGLPGLGFYLLARAGGADLVVAPSTLGDTWWRVPVLVLLAAGNAIAEEGLVVGYLLTRLRQLGWPENASLAASAVLRGSYHLYQGPGAGLGNLVMGLVFGRVWQRTNRLWVLIVAHTVLDIVSFVGYALLVNRVSWLR